MPAKTKGLTFWGDEEDLPADRSARLTFLDYAAKVLRRTRHALTPAEIWEHPEGADWRERVHTRGDMQVQTLASALYADVQRPASRFVRVGSMPARFGLRRETGAPRRGPRPGLLVALENPAMPGLLHVAVWSNAELVPAFRQMRSPWMPLPFQCAAAWRVADRSTVEAALAKSFGACRANPKKAFYALALDLLRGWAEVLGAEDATESVRRTLEKEIPAAEQRAAARFRARNENAPLLPLLGG